ncbi:unnamed protein product [Mytilus coruscus]|nr:unnamed protein product [Mytilus coruscus]
MAIDTKNGLAFLYDSETKVINKASLRTHGQLQDIVIAIGEVQDIAVDNIKEKLYWTDRQLRSIGVANYDGSAVSKLINNLNSPKSLAIDSEKGIMFWSDDFDQSVEQLIIGECVRSVIMRDVIATTLTVDTESHVLYIYENYSNRLIAYSYIDVAPAWTPIPLSQHIYGISVFQGSLITILSKDSYACINIWNNTELNTSSYCDIGFGKIHQLITSFTETKGYRHNENNKDENPDCAVSKARCIKYSKNRKHCILASRNYDDSPFLLIADQRGRALYKIDVESMEKSVIPVKELDQPYGISFDMLDDMVYWTDIGSRQNSISRAYLDGSFQEIIFSHQDLYSTAVEIDSDLRLAFFSDFSFHRIGVLHIPSLTYKYILQEEHFYPFAFHLHTHNNYPEIYISKHGSFPRIVSSIIGSGKTIGVTDEAVKPRGIYLDEKDLYWIDSYDNTVKYINTTSGNPSTMLHGYLHEIEMRDLELYRNKYMFVSDVKNGRLMRFNLTEMHEKMDTSSYMIATTITDLYAPSGMTLVDLFKFDLKGFCIIPHTLDANVEVINARRRAMVYNGYTLSVSCKGGLQLENSNSPIRCINGNWTNLPKCLILEKSSATANSMFLHQQCDQDSLGKYLVNLQAEISSDDEECILANIGLFELKPVDLLDTEIELILERNLPPSEPQETIQPGPSAGLQTQNFVLPSCSKRFKPMEEDELQSLPSVQINKTEHKKGVKLFREWCLESSGRHLDFNCVTKIDLNNKLRHFYAEAKPKITEKRAQSMPHERAGLYHKNTLKNVRAALHRHLKDINRDFDIVKDNEFRPRNILY